MSNSQDIQYIAQELYESGLNVIPLSGKRPITPNWSEYCTKEIPDSMFQDFDFSGGIGITLGTYNNLCCVDIDIVDEEEANKIVRMLQPTPFCKIGKKGCTLFYKQPLTPVTRQIKTIQLKSGQVEFFFSGKQTVLPPTIHPETGKPYYWSSQHITSKTDIEEEAPYFDMQYMYLIEQVSKGDNQPKLGAKQGRNDHLKSLTHKLLDCRVEERKLIAALLEEDSKMFGEGGLFVSSDCGYSYPYANAKSFLNNICKSYNRNVPGEALKVPCDWVYSSDDSKTEELVWEDPIDYSEDGSVFPIDIIPESMRDYITTMSKSTTLAPESYFMSLLCSLSALTGTRYHVYPLRNKGDWCEGTNIYIMQIDIAGRMKTSRESLAMKPLNVLMSEKKDKYALEKKRKLAARNKAKTEVKILTKKMDQATCDENHEEADRLAMRIEDLSHVANQEVGDVNFISYTNSTWQQLVQTSATNPYGQLIICPEFSVFAQQLAKNDNIEYKAYILNMHNDKKFEYCTKTQGKYSIENGCISVHCSTQDSAISKYISLVLNGHMIDDGFMQRFIPVISGKRYDYQADIETSGDFPKHLQLIYNRAESSEPVKKVYMTKEAEVEIERIKYYTLYNDERDNFKSSFISKKRGAVVKLAFLLQFIKDEGIIKDIDKDSVLKAENIMDIFLGRFFRFSAVNASKLSDYRSEFAALVRSQQITDGMTLKEVSKIGKFRDSPQDFNSVIDDMVETKRIKLVAISNTATIIKLNPKYAKKPS